MRPGLTVVLASLVILLCGALLSALPARAESAPWPQTELFVKYPWLAPPSEGWLVQELDLTKGNPKTSLGAVGVGNGTVFGLMGLDMPQNAISNLIGPGYETSEQFFGPIWHELVKVDSRGNVVEQIKFKRSRLYRVPETGVIVVQEINDDFLMTTVAYTLPGRPYIARIVSLKSLSKTPFDGIQIQIKEKGSDIEGEDIPAWLQNCSQTGVLHRIKNRLLCLSVDNGNPDKLDVLSKDLSTSEKYGLIALWFWDVRIPPSRTVLENPHIEQLDDIQKVSTNFLQITSDAPRIGSLFENTLSMLNTQTVPLNGAVAVMARYSGAWCRDAFGPILFYLKAGKYEEAKRVASFYDYASRLLGFRNRYPVDLDLRKAPEEFDWQSIAPQQGDDPNILILHIYNVWRAMGDDNQIREHYGFMKRNLLGQDTGDWHLPFHGDETYQVYVMMQEGAPMKDFYSVDTSFWYAVAAESLAEMADAIGETADAAEFRKRAQQCREHAENYYWDKNKGHYTPFVKKSDLAPASAPFGDINLHALWTGYASAADPRQRENVINTAKQLMKKNGLMKTSPRVAYYTGMLPGYLLWNLKAIGLTERADKAYDGLFNVAMSPLGEFAEAYDGNDRWLDYSHAPNVYRPWETAINADAVLYYLTGYHYGHRAARLTLQPHLPPGANNMTISNLHAGPHKIALTMNRDPDNPARMFVSVTNTGGKPVEIELLLEIIQGEPAPAGFEAFEYANYQRTMWRKSAALETGAAVAGYGGLTQ